MALIGNMLTALLAAFLLVSGAEAQTDLDFATCDDDVSTDSEKGNALRTCKSSNELIRF
jgi:hypothetical protein